MYTAPSFNHVHCTLLWQYILHPPLIIYTSPSSDHVYCTLLWSCTLHPSLIIYTSPSSDHVYCTLSLSDSVYCNLCPVIHNSPSSDHVHCILPNTYIFHHAPNNVYFTLPLITISPILPLISGVSIPSALVFDWAAGKLSPVWFHNCVNSWSISWILDNFFSLISFAAVFVHVHMRVFLRALAKWVEYWWEHLLNFCSYFVGHLIVWYLSLHKICYWGT